MLNQSLQERLSQLGAELNQIREITKLAFIAAPPMPQGAPPPPADPSMMQQGGAPPMDPSMMQGAPPMDPAMMQQGGAPPMDPSMMQGAPPADPAAGQAGMPPELMDQVVGLLEEMGGKLSAVEQTQAQMQQAVETALNDLTEQVTDIDKRLAELAATSSAQPVGSPAPAAQPPTAWS